MSIILHKVAHYVPERVITNDQLIERESLKIKASWVEHRIGIKERRWAHDDESASDLAIKAIHKLGLQNFNGALWLATISQDYLTPSTSSLIKAKLGWKHDAPTFDVNGACAGHLFALEMAYHRLLNTSETEALVVASEVRSRFTNPKDRRTVFLFADGAAVFHLKKNEDSEHSGIEWTLSKTLTSETLDIYIPAGGSTLPLSKLTDPSDAFIKMNDGPKIFELTTNALVQSITESIQGKGQTLDNFSFFVFHQGNTAIITTVLEKLGISLEKTHINFDRYGNTSSASMGIALSEAYELGKINKGDRVLLLAMGAGHHLSMASIVWS
jgi:3-oxoacyl-[acyl-carrier-protein] synthase III